MEPQYSTESRRLNFTVFLICLFLFSYEFFHYFWRFHTGDFIQGQGFTILPAGDFGVMYDWANTLRQSYDKFLALKNCNYTPFAILIYIPFTYLSKKIAYYLFVTLTSLTLFGSIHLSTFPLKQSLFQQRLSHYLLFVFSLWALLMNSYPVMFSIERGNSDIITIFFAILFLFYFKKDKPYLAVIFLTLASQYKMYPALLCFLFFVRGYYLPLLNYLLLNCALLFILGYRGLIHFFWGAYNILDNYNFSLNHSLKSYLKYLSVNHFVDSNPKPLTIKLTCLLLGGFFILCLALWTKQRYIFQKQSINPREGEFKFSEISLIGMSFYLMGLLPPVSHDYKLIIMIFPFLLYLTHFAKVNANSKINYVLSTVIALLLPINLIPPFGTPKTLGLILLFLFYFIASTWSIFYFRDET